ncbi:hypothetical protein H0I54_17070 [Yersinia kristensenii]|uniref:hypothetical protein n=2 Tax=Yersinia kristensenii TaxID=28152 RepID=UPI001C60B1DB|nr:hypothetical protein [Yersinia kristensenii]MBW5812404.1 hypothetical protein [Yersinia kristensenii]MBW5843519.1 hypothetical protein [Yersinia kristensenii]MDA5490658.1 hypothetical protein [Yersinia kristensenii]
MKSNKNSSLLLSLKPTLVFFIALIIFCFAMKLSWENKKNSQQYDILNSKVTSLSSIAERLKMKRNSNSGVSELSSESLNDALMKLFNENSIALKITYLQQNSILLEVKMADFSQLLNVFLILSQDERFEISNANITINKDNDYVNGYVTLLCK